MTCRFSKGSVLMNPYLKNYKLKLKVLSPVFIGSGKQINKLEYIFDGKRIYVADMNKLMSEVVKRGLAESFYMLMQSHEVYLKEWLDRNGMNDYGQYAAYELNGVENVDSSRSLKGIDTFMRNAYNEPYIPGSSIKGMLRTIILWNEIYDNADNLGKTRDEIKHIVRAANRNSIKKELKRCSGDLERRYLSKTESDNKKTQLMRGLIVGDSKPLSNDDLVLCKKIDVHCNGRKREINIFRECLKPGTSTELSLTIDERIFPYSAECLTDMIHDYADDQSYIVTNFFPKCFGSDEDDNAIILGGGSGYFSKTITYSLFEKDDAVDVVSQYLGKTTCKKHGHFDDKRIGISPHMHKCTKYHGMLYEMGKCAVEIV